MDVDVLKLDEREDGLEVEDLENALQHKFAQAISTENAVKYYEFY